MKLLSTFYFQDKSKRNTKKLALVESALEDPESRVVDCLLEALKTGSAFSREEKRKRQCRPEGGESIDCSGLDCSECN